MADKVRSIDGCISTANNLKATVNKVFQDLATDPGVNKEPGDSSETSKGESITQTLKKNLTNIHRALRYVRVLNSRANYIWRSMPAKNQLSHSTSKFNIQHSTYAFNIQLKLSTANFGTQRPTLK